MHKYALKNVLTITSLDLRNQTLEDSVLQAHPFLRGLSIRTYRNTRATIIIGIDNAKLGVPLAVKESKIAGVIARKSRLGWSFYGRGNDRSRERQMLMHRRYGKGKFYTRSSRSLRFGGCS